MTEDPGRPRRGPERYRGGRPGTAVEAHDRDVVEEVVARCGAPSPGPSRRPSRARAVLPRSKRLKSVSVRPATQWAAVTTRSGATTVPPQPPTPANHGTVASSTRSPPITAWAGAAQTSSAAQVAKRIFITPTVTAPGARHDAENPSPKVPPSELAASFIDERPRATRASDRLRGRGAVRGRAPRAATSTSTTPPARRCWPPCGTWSRPSCPGTAACTAAPARSRRSRPRPTSTRATSSRASSAPRARASSSCATRPRRSTSSRPRCRRARRCSRRPSSTTPTCSPGAGTTCSMLPFTTLGRRAARRSPSARCARPRSTCWR